METVNTTGENAVQTNAAVEGEGHGVAVANPNSFTHGFYFRSMLDTVENREAISKLGEIEESEDDSVPPKKLIRRATETYTFTLPEINTGNEKLDVVMREIIKNEIISAAKVYVNKGEVPDRSKLTWEALIDQKYIAITTAGAADEAGSGFNAALLKEVASKFASYMKALGKDETGISVMAKMITGRFSVITTHKYIAGLDMVKGNLESWLLEGCDEAEQETYSDVTEYLLKKLEEAKTPQVVDTGSLF